MDEDFATCFGFTDEEVKWACEARGAGDRYEEAKSWYNGYRFGGRDMYNPWSITRYLEKLIVENYWVYTGGVSVLRDLFHKGDDGLRDDIASLLTGGTVTMSLEDGIAYPIVYADSGAFWTLLLNSGYIKPCNGSKPGRFEAELVNMEVRSIFTSYAEDWLREHRPSISDSIQTFISCLLQGDAEGVGRTLNEDLLNGPSSFDLVAENSYHMFIYGMLLAASDKYVVTSNREAGKGRSDCAIKPFDKSGNAVVVEFKHIRELPPGGASLKLRRGDRLTHASSDELPPRESDALKQEAIDALRQIGKKAYVHDLEREGYKSILKYGIAFHKKNCEVAMQTV